MTAVPARLLLQAHHLLALLPTLEQRLCALLALYPALYDPANITDLALALDRPVPLALTPEERQVRGSGGMGARVLVFELHPTP